MSARGRGLAAGRGRGVGLVGLLDATDSADVTAADPAADRVVVGSAPRPAALRQAATTVRLGAVPRGKSGERAAVQPMRTCGSATDAEAQHRAGDSVPGPDRARSSTAWSASCISARSRRLQQGARCLSWTRPQPHPWHGCAGGAVRLFSGRVPSNGCGGFG